MTYNNGTTYNNGITYLQGQLLPNTTGISIGSPSQPFNNIYTSNSTISLANSNLTLAGSLTVLDPTGANNTFYVANVGYGFMRTNTPITGRAVMIISANPSSNVVPVANTQVGGVLHLVGGANGATIVTMDNFDTSNPTLAADVVAFRRFRGNVDYPAPVQSGDALGGLVALGAYTTGSPGSPLPISPTSSTYGRIQFVATENYTLANNGQQLVISVVPNQSNVSTQTVIINANTTSLLSNNVNIAGNISIYGTETRYGNSISNGTTTWNANIISNASLTANTITANSITISGNTVPTQNNNTWTPNVTFATTQTTYSSSGIVLKTGRQVFATFNVITSGTGTGGVSLNISSIFAATNSGSAVSGTAFVSFLGGSAAPSALSPAITGTMSGPILAGATSIPLYATFTAAGGGGSTTYRQVTGADIGATGQIAGHIQYISAS